MSHRAHLHALATALLIAGMIVLTDVRHGQGIPVARSVAATFARAQTVDAAANDAPSTAEPATQASGAQTAATPSAATQTFERASITPCAPNTPPPPGSRFTMTRGADGGVGVYWVSTSPGRLSVTCATLENLLQEAYFGHGFNPDRSPILGGPDWIRSARWSVDANAEGTPSAAVMKGPMLQAFIDERFMLKSHRETKEIPVYVLTVAKSGFTVSPLPEGTCPPPGAPPQPAPEPPGPGQRRPVPRCGSTGLKSDGLHVEQTGQGVTVAEFFNSIGDVDRPVVDKTGLSGLYDFHLAYSRGSAPFFRAVQEQLGLRLEPSKGPAEFLVIDHAERPTR